MKHCTDLLKVTLTNIYNAFLVSGIFPDQLKLAKVLPVRKKVDTRDVRNYRPIALIPVFKITREFVVK